MNHNRRIVRLRDSCRFAVFADFKFYCFKRKNCCSPPTGKVVLMDCAFVVRSLVTLVQFVSKVELLSRTKLVAEAGHDSETPPTVWLMVNNGPGIVIARFPLLKFDG